MVTSSIRTSFPLSWNKVAAVAISSPPAAAPGSNGRHGPRAVGAKIGKTRRSQGPDEPGNPLRRTVRGNVCGLMRVVNHEPRVLVTAHAGKACSGVGLLKDESELDVRPTFIIAFCLREKSKGRHTLRPWHQGRTTFDFVHRHPRLHLFRRQTPWSSAFGLWTNGNGLRTDAAGPLRALSRIGLGTEKKEGANWGRRLRVVRHEARVSACRWRAVPLI
ncbi:hypothetical protein V8E53_001723, partial [Lactarius tabidus]